MSFRAMVALARCAAVVFIASTALSAFAIGRRDAKADFVIRHPEIAANADFRKWLQTSRFGNWRELPRSDNQQTVIVQETLNPTGRPDKNDIANGSVFAAGLELIGNTAKIANVHTFFRADVSRAYEAALHAHAAATVFEPADDGATVTFAEPVATFGLINVLTFQFVKMALPSHDASNPHPCTDGYDDALSDDDLHHLSALAAEARLVVTCPADIQKSAEELCHYVFKQVHYDSYGILSVYTIADTLTLEHHRGQCDAMAVLLVSYLRALNIPARIKFLSWTRDGDEEEHACVEYYAAGTAYHLDPTRDYVRTPECYRQVAILGLLPDDVFVLDADWPNDARSTSPIGTFDDSSSTDGLLNPTEDFCFTPADKQPEPRKGYTYD